MVGCYICSHSVCILKQNEVSGPLIKCDSCSYYLLKEIFFFESANTWYDKAGALIFNMIFKELWNKNPLLDYCAKQVYLMHWVAITQPLITCLCVSVLLCSSGDTEAGNMRAMLASSFHKCGTKSPKAQLSPQALWLEIPLYPAEPTLLEPRHTSSFCLLRLPQRACFLYKVGDWSVIQPDSFINHNELSMVSKQRLWEREDVPWKKHHYLQCR